MLVLSPGNARRNSIFVYLYLSVHTFVCVLARTVAKLSSWYTGMRYCDRYNWLSLGALQAQTWPNRQFRAKLVQNRLRFVI